MNRYTCIVCGEWLRDDEEQTCRECLRDEHDLEIYMHSHPDEDGKRTYEELVALMIARRVLDELPPDS